MMRIISTVISLFLIYFSSAQDIIVLKNGDEIPAKITEVTPTEVKYARFDNLQGPLYTILKGTVFMIKYENGTKEVISGSSGSSTEMNTEKCTVYFVRKSGYAGSMAGYHVFIDEKEICKLNNGKYITREIPTGLHTFSVQYSGTNSKSKAEKLEINTEPGLTYYVKVTQGGKVMASDTWCIQISEEEAKELLKKLERDSDCN